MFCEYVKTRSVPEMLSAPGSYAPYPARKNRKAWEGLDRAKKEAILSWGEEALAGYPMVCATQFMAFSRTGSRLVFEEPYFERRKKLMGAAIAECVADDGRFMDAIVDGIWCICEETSWVLSAHNGSDHPGQRPQSERILPDQENPFVDLFAAQTASLLADILYLLEDKLNSVSPLIARRVRREIDKRVLCPFMDHDDFWWMGMIRKDVCNWTPWILSNVIECFLLLERDAVRRAEGIVRSMRMLDSYLAVLPEDGGCDEGAGYFNMAGASLFDCLESLYLASDGKISFFEEPFIRAICAFPARAHIQGPWFINFADCDAQPYLDGERLVSIGRRMQMKDMVGLGRMLMAQDADVKPKDTPQMNRVLLRLFAKIPETVEHPEVGHETLPALQLYTWRKDGLYAAIKGGTNGESHNHNDVGTFIVYADGVPQIVDLGNRIYTAATFGQERYTLINTRSRNHCVPLIGGYEQVAGKEHCAANVRESQNGVVMDIARAYPEEAGVSQALRMVCLTDDGFMLSDKIQLLQEKDVSFVFMLAEKPEIREDRVLLSRITLQFDDELSPELSFIPADDKRMARNFPEGIWRLSLTGKKQMAHEYSFAIGRRGKNGKSCCTEFAQNPLGS